MGTVVFRFDLYLRLPKEYYNLLKKAEEVMRSPSSLQYQPNYIGDVYLEADGHYGPLKFINMCVPDSLLMAFYNCYIQFDHIKSLFNSFERLRAPMAFLTNKMYNEAKAAWLYWSQLNIAKDEFGQFVTNAWSEPKDHLPMFIDLTMSINTLSKFEGLGTVYSLGFNDLNPLLILVDIHPELDTAPLQYIDDDYNRPYEQQFLLMSEKNIPHMIAALHVFDHWILYDDLKKSYEPFNPKEADFKEEYTIHLAGYVKIQDNHVAVGVAEEGHHTTLPFNPPVFEKEHLD